MTSECMCNQPLPAAALYKAAEAGRSTCVLSVVEKGFGGERSSTNRMREPEQHRAAKY